MWLVRLCVSFSFISPLASVLFNCSSSIAVENVLTDEVPFLPQIDAGVGLLRYTELHYNLLRELLCQPYLNMQVGLKEEADC